MKKTHWIELVILFFILFFLAPLAESQFLGNWFSYVIYVPMACLGLVFFLYPFFKGAIEIRNNNKRLGVLLMVFGLIVPVMSGFISIIIIEIAGNKALTSENT